MDNQTGAGLVVHKGCRELRTEWFRLPNGTTVFQAEVAAVAQAAVSLLSLDDAELKYIKIFIDSQAAISALGNPHVTSSVVADAINKLNELASVARSVTLVWIPAHKGHVGNERADELAKRGSEETDPNRLLKVGLPMATLKATIKGRIYEEWKSEWTASKMAAHTKSFYAGPNEGKARFVLKLARLELGRFVRIITGHNNLGFFQNKLGLMNSGECRFCETGVETVTHLLSRCPRFVLTRNDIFMDTMPTDDMTWSVRNLLDFSYSPGINEAFEGTWVNGDPLPEADSSLDISLGLDWLMDEEEN